jgi:hypothetical protein
MVRVNTPRACRATLLVIYALIGCTGQRDSQTGRIDTSGAKSVATVLKQGSRVPGAEARLSAFLRGSLETSPPTETNLLMACVPDGQTDRYVTLARYRVLSSASRGDSVDASAEAVTVAEEVGDPHAASKYVATVRVRVDTLHWVMVRDSATGKWGVCGYPKEGVGFGHYGDEQDTRWEPPTASWARVRQLAESMQVHR